MATTKWIKTMSNNQLVNQIYTSESNSIGFNSPDPFVCSGNGKVFYFESDDGGIVRYEYIDNTWTYDKFLVSQNNIAGTKYLPDPTYTYPVATNPDGTTLVIMKNKQKIIITSYINGQLVQVSPEITFTKQSNYNLEGQNRTTCTIQRVFMSSNGLKIVLITYGGINTLVFSNGSWNLLPPSGDILPSYFPYAQYGEISAASKMSTNGMYLTLLALNSILVFKFNTQTNSWVLFKQIAHDSLNSYSGGIYVVESFVSNTGIVLARTGYMALCRFEYSVSSGNYEFINTSTLATPFWETRCFVSDDFNTFLCRRGNFEWPPTYAPRQYIRMLKWINGNWEIVNFPSDIMPIMTTDSNETARVLGMSSDGGTFITTPILTSERNIINVYYNVPLPTLHLGDMVRIKETDVSFNEANVFVKDPTVALNVSNKQYVDMADEEIHALILAGATTDTTSTTEYYDLLGQRQTVQSNLATQIENLYQYFFDRSRNGPAPSRT